MTLTIIIYIVLLLIFLVVSSLIFRHMVRYSYLSSRFKTVVGIFGVIALAVIIFSVYLLMMLGRESSGNFFDSPAPGGDSGGSSSSVDLNF